MTVSTKTALRREYRLRRDAYVAAMPPADRRLAFSQPPTPLRLLFGSARIVAAYAATGSEADPAALLAAAASAGCQTALPHVTGRSSPMRFLAWAPGDTLVAGPFGLQQPDGNAALLRPDLLLVPLLAFDDRLTRLGQGAGHYDRALPDLPGALTIGVGWSVQQATQLPTDAWDVPMFAILTEKSWMTS